MRKKPGPKPRKPGDPKPNWGWQVPDEKELEEIADKYSGRKKIGRPTNYTPEFGEWVCQIVATHPYGLEKLRKLIPGFPDQSVIWQWRQKNPSFRKLYDLAKLEQAELHTEEIINIADTTEDDLKLNKAGDVVANNEVIQRSKLKIDTRKWLAAKLLPKKFGDQISIESLQEQNESLRRELAEYRAKLDEKNKKDF